MFDGVEHADTDLEFTVKVGVMEIYMERIRDLVEPAKDNLVVREDPVRARPPPCFLCRAPDPAAPPPSPVCPRARRSKACTWRAPRTCT